MLTDKEAEEIERKRNSGVSSGPILLAWVDGLLADRKERVRQLQYLRQRLNQAFRYLDARARCPDFHAAPRCGQQGETPLLPQLRAALCSRLRDLS